MHVVYRLSSCNFLHNFGESINYLFSAARGQTQKFMVPRTMPPPEDFIWKISSESQILNQKRSGPKLATKHGSNFVSGQTPFSAHDQCLGLSDRLSGPLDPALKPHCFMGMILENAGGWGGKYWTSTAVDTPSITCVMHVHQKTVTQNSLLLPSSPSQKKKLSSCADT